MQGTEDIVDELRRIDEQLSDLAYDRLRSALDETDPSAEAEERKLQQARRALQRAIQALGGTGGLESF